MNKQDKIQEGLTLLDDRNNYVALETPMVKDTFQSAFPHTFHFKPILIFGGC